LRGERGDAHYIGDQCSEAAGQPAVPPHPGENGAHAEESAAEKFANG